MTEGNRLAQERGIDGSEPGSVFLGAFWPARPDSAGTIVLAVARTLWLALAMYALFSFFFQGLPSVVPHHGPISVVIALCMAGFIASQRELIGVCVRRCVTKVESYSTYTWIVGCLLAGSMLRLFIGLSLPSELFSDPAAYWELTERLARDGIYAIAGTRSYWPPGFPFFLFVPVAMFGPEPWIPVVLNVLLYVGTSVLAFRLAERLAGKVAGRLVVLILALWPNLVLTSAGPHKELFVMFLVTAAMLSYLVAADRSHTGTTRWISTLACGLCLGLSALTQPSTIFLGFVFLVYELTVAQGQFGKAFWRLMSVGLIAAMSVLPWTARNYVVHGELVPINTAGGVNFYSANNPNASGGWIPDDLYLDDSLRGAGELHQNRVGYERGVRWIKENKAEFLKLMMYKHSRYLCCDSFGAFWLWEHPGSTVDRNPVLGKIAGWLSDAFWLLLWLIVIFGAATWKHVPVVQPSLALLLSLPVLYSLAVHGIYQSEGKHHIWVAALLATIVAAALSPGTKKTAGGNALREAV
jgi:4-amino-4-deoxy-L-arabinose transferase-like glycosyltransferase